MIIDAPAKINLYLGILGKRKDGYHNIETVFEKIALSDRIVLKKYNRIKITCKHPGVPVGTGSLMYRTVNLLRKKYNIKEGAEVEIIKKIPVAAGLGGGSSDAASVLMGLNKMWKLSLNLSGLTECGKRLGADIPFFLSGKTFAFAKGRGDKIEPLNWKIRLWHLVISPPVKLLSKDVYRSYRRHLPAGKAGKTPACRQGRPACRQGREDRRQIGYEGTLQNDLEKVVLREVPLVRRIKKALKAIGIDSLVSGSGPSVFALFEKRKEATRAKESLIRRFPVVRDKGWQTFIVPTL